MARSRINSKKIEDSDGLKRLSNSLLLALVSVVVIIGFSFGAYEYQENNISSEEKTARLQDRNNLSVGEVKSTIGTESDKNAAQEASSIIVVLPTQEERASIKLKIINGTGVVSGADAVAGKLEQTGYKISSMEMGQLYSSLAATIRYSKGSEKMALEINSLFNNQAEMQIGDELINNIVIILGTTFK